MLQVYQGGFAGGATSMDLAAAQALAELRHEDDVHDDDSMESGEEQAELAEEEEHRGGSRGADYDRGFRVTAPPLPLWLPGDFMHSSTISSMHAFMQSTKRLQVRMRP